MKVQNKKRDNEINLQPDTLTDLSVPNEHAQQAKGGPDSTRSDGTISMPITFTYRVNNTGSCPD